MSARGPSPSEERNVLGLVERARRSGAQVIAFIRDSDGDRVRAAQIDAAIEQARQLFAGIEVIGAPAVPVLEAWLLAWLGQTGTEKLSKARAQSLLQGRIPAKDTAAMVQLVNDAPAQRIPSDATRLRAWLVRAEAVLPK